MSLILNDDLALFRTQKQDVNIVLKSLIHGHKNKTFHKLSYAIWPLKSDRTLTHKSRTWHVNGRGIVDTEDLTFNSETENIQIPTKYAASPVHIQYEKKTHL